MVHKKEAADACRGCLYWRPVYFRGRSPAPSRCGLYACHYCLVNGHSRLCPPGAECVRRAEAPRRG